MERFTHLIKSCGELYAAISDAGNLPNIREKGPLLLDGILDTASNTLKNIAIFLAARKAGFCSRAKYLYYDEQPFLQLYRSIGIEPLQVDVFSNTLWHRALNQIQSRLPWPKDRQKLFQISHRDLDLTKYAIDSAIRYQQNTYRPEDVDRMTAITYRDVARRTSKAMDQIVDEENPIGLVLSHKYYNGFGILGAVAVSRNVPVFSIAGGYVKKFSLLADFDRDDFSQTPELINELAEAIPAEVALKYADDRFRGKGKDMDSANGYVGKRVVSKEEIVRELNLDPSKPIAIIMAHAFSDANYVEPWMIYNSYFNWYQRVLQIASSFPHINWIVRTHPSSHMYSEIGVGPSVAANYAHVRIMSDDVQTSSVFDFADAILTVRGTAGLEAIYFGIPAILGGGAWYDNLPGVVSCHTEEALVTAMKNIRKRPEKVGSEEANFQKLKASRALYFRFASYDFTTDAIGKDRNPGLSPDDARSHDAALIERFSNRFRNPCEFWNDSYVAGLVRMFENQQDRLSILELARINLVKTV